MAGCSLSHSPRSSASFASYSSRTASIRKNSCILASLRSLIIVFLNFGWMFTSYSCVYCSFVSSSSLTVSSFSALSRLILSRSSFLLANSAAACFFSSSYFYFASSCIFFYCSATCLRKCSRKAGCTLA